MSTYTIFGKPSCPYCDRAKQLLSKYNIEYTYVDLSLDEARLKQFKEQGFRTVPIIYDDDQYIGGFDELQDYLMEILV
jgi:glutaredoxin 3